MAFEITKTFVVKAPPEAVWAFLTDPERVAKCLPGAAVTGKLDDKTWEGTMTVKVGPVSSSYKGKVVFERLDAASRRAEIVAQGMDVRGKGGAELRLQSSVVPQAHGETEVTTVSKVSVTGILAQMGRGMVQDVSDQLFKVFTERVRSELESTAPAEPAKPAGLSSSSTPGAPPQAAAALDLGALGARVVVRRPEFWVVVAVAAGLLYLLLR